MNVLDNFTVRYTKENTIVAMRSMFAMYSTRASKPKDTNHTSTHLAQDNHDILTQDIEILQYEISISMKFVHLELVLLIGVTLAMPNDNTCSSKSGDPQDNPIATLRIWQWYIPLG